MKYGAHAARQHCPTEDAILILLLGKIFRISILRRKLDI
jgi:hypothetical protein